MDKYLIVGLGNPGSEYAGTRHNAGYMVLDAFAKASNISFQDRRYGYVAETSIKGRKVFLLKPTTYMNLSGNAVRYWLTKENIDQSRLLVVSDEVALPLGQSQRLKRRTQRPRPHPATHRTAVCPSAHGHRQRFSPRHASAVGARTVRRRRAANVAARH